jgi:hypothetical protein
MERGDYAEGLTDLAASYPSRKRDITASELDSYWSAHEKYPLDWLLAGMQAAKLLHPRFMPSAGEIVQAAKHAEQEGQRKTLVTPAMADAIAHGEVFCGACEDTGFAPAPTQGGYTFVRVCECRPTNQIYQARRARERRSVAQEN